MKLRVRVHLEHVLISQREQLTRALSEQAKINAHISEHKQMIAELEEELSSDVPTS